MKRQQLLLASGGLVLVVVLFFFGKTVPPKSNTPAPVAQQPAQAATIQFSDLLFKAKQRLSPEQSERITRLENGVTRGDVKEQQLHIYHQLARFWKDSAHIFEPYAYYTSEAAKLENSEKNLTFAARLFLDQLMISNDPPMQNWLASNAKVLFDKALEINPSNDSSKIGLGACYMLGNISDNPMQGILPVREIAEKDPNNMYAQYILGLGGKKSGQYDKAIERFKIIVDKQPDNIEVELHLAECYDMKGDKEDAIKWYSAVKKKIANPNAQKELDSRINSLKQ
ncbi:tetratricopeptide repeat protein [Chitinophagaceae bacterium LWZ2-11]